MEASSVPGRIVRSAETGATLGLVEEVLFDPVQRRLWALRTHMHGGVRLIPLSAIQAFVGDTVILPACELRHPGALPLQAAALELRTLLRASAMTARGQRLGRVAEVEVYPSDGRITALTITCGGYFGVGARVERVAGERIVRFERRAVIVGPSPALVADLPPHA